MNKKGFTLIELLVVVAIIGILAVVVLSSLGSARNKTKDAAVKSTLSSYRKNFEINFEGEFDNLCESDVFDELRQKVISYSGGFEECDATTNEYRIIFMLPSYALEESIFKNRVYAIANDSFCINSLGESSHLDSDNIPVFPSCDSGSSAESGGGGLNQYGGHVGQPLTGTILMGDVGYDWQNRYITGYGTSFTSDLTPGDKIAFVNQDGDAVYGTVDVIWGDDYFGIAEGVFVDIDGNPVPQGGDGTYGGFLPGHQYSFEKVVD